MSRRDLLENEPVLCIADAYQVTHGHSLMIPQRHADDVLALHQPKWNVVVERRKQLRVEDASISGWNVGLIQVRQWGRRCIMRIGI